MMKKIILLIISASLVMLLLSGCMLVNKVNTQPENNYTVALGLRPLPGDFLNWWFDQLKNKQNGSNSIQSKKPLKLIATNDEIANTQQLLTQSTSQNPNPPFSYDLRNYNDVPPVGNQGQANDCWAYSTVESLESAMLVQLGPSGISADYPFINDPNNPQLSVQFAAYNNYDWNLSPHELTGYYFISYQETNQDNGGNHFFAFYNLAVRGVPLSSDFPYEDSADASYIQWDPTNGYWPQDLVKAQYAYVIPSAEWFYDNSYSYTDYIDTIQSAIMTYGAVAVDFTEYSDFPNYEYWQAPCSNWVYIPSSTANPTSSGHAVILIGWNDNGGTNYSGPVWILQNQWGSSWANNGYFMLPIITQEQYNDIGSNPQAIGYWQIESNPGGMYVPAL